MGWEPSIWADNYPMSYLAIYNREIQKDPAEALRGLWQWKTLHRTGLEPQELIPYLELAQELCAEMDEPLSASTLDEATNAFLQLRNELKSEDGPLSPNSRVIVTPQFLLHIADSNDGYSARFPILDVMVARAHRVHTAVDSSKTLQRSLTGGEGYYRELVGYLLNQSSTPKEVPRLERAHFVQGQAIAFYKANESGFDDIGNLPVSKARDYLRDIELNL